MTSRSGKGRSGRLQNLLRDLGFQPYNHLHDSAAPALDDFELRGYAQARDDFHVATGSRRQNLANDRHSLPQDYHVS